MAALSNGAADDFTERVVEELKNEQNKTSDTSTTTNNTLTEKEQPELNVVPILQNATINLIYRFITHHDIQSLKEQDFSSGYTCKESFFSTYLQALINIRLIIYPKSQSWLFYLSPLAYKMASPTWTYRERGTLKSIHEFSRIACRNAQPSSPLALLQDRPSHGGGSNSTTTTTTSDTITKAMLDEAVTLLFAGQDTSAATLSWTIHLLTLYPNVQEKLATCIQEQYVKQFGKSLDAAKSKEDPNNTTWFTKKFVTSIPYLDAVLKESMRLYPVAPYIIRHLTDDITIPPESCKGKDAKSNTLPKGSIALICIYAMQRNPELWHRPDDFIPERWIDPDLQKLDSGQKTGAWMPFAYGPRNCVGQPMAHVVIRILLARIVSEWHLTDKRLNAVGDDVDVSQFRKPMQVGFTVLPDDGVYLSFQKRCSK